ncbi:MAG: MaoC family dehydratase N-terminal domain-containing protein [Dehalococcoidia bacterium]
MTRHLVYWEDLEEGSEVPPITLEITRDRVVMIVCATRDIFPLHHDPEFARAAGHKAPAVAIAFLQGLLARCLTDWSGPTGKIQKISLNLKEPSYAGDTITVGGRLSRKYVESGDHKVDCELRITNQDGTVTVDARATAVLPSKA